MMNLALALASCQWQRSPAGVANLEDALIHQAAVKICWQLLKEGTQSRRQFWGKKNERFGDDFNEFQSDFSDKRLRQQNSSQYTAFQNACAPDLTSTHSPTL